MHIFDIVWNVAAGPAMLAAFAGVLWGIIGGALPGISASIAMALVVPFTFGMEPVTAIVLLASIYVGAEYGGSIPAILIRTPGTNSAAATTIDGYELHKLGRGGEALGVSLVCGTIGSLVGLILLIVLTEPLSRLALAFTPPAYFALGVLGISVIASLAEGSVVKGLIAGTIGIMISTVGSDPLSGVTRFTFGQPELLSGISVILVMMGVFAVSELLVQASLPPWDQTARSTRLKLPSLKTLRQLAPAQVIGCVIGTIEGITPGVGGSVAAFMSYNEARRWSREPEKFGKGSLEAVAAPETANNTVACTALVPLLSLGIPGSNSTAVLLGALLIQGIHPGPMLFTSNPDFVYQLFAGLFLAIVAMFIIGLTVLTPCIWLVNRPKPFLMAAIFALIMSGAYALNYSSFDLGIVLAAGVLGFLLRMLRFPFLPLVLGLVLGFMIESNLRRSLMLSNGDYLIFLRDPISLVLLALAALIIVSTGIWPLLSTLRARRQELRG
jgi:putative tricarboxylic transport membrane protein